MVCRALQAGAWRFVFVLPFSPVADALKNAASIALSLSLSPGDIRSNRIGQVKCVLCHPSEEEKKSISQRMVESKDASYEYRMEGHCFSSSPLKADESFHMTK